MKIQIFRNLWVLLAFFLLLAPSGVQAQKKEIVAAKDLVKAGKEPIIARPCSSSV